MILKIWLKKLGSQKRSEFITVFRYRLDLIDIFRLNKYVDFHQAIRDNYEQVKRNDKRARHIEIQLDEKYKTPAEYKRMLEDLERWSKMPPMRDLAGYSRTLARKANELLTGKGFG